MRKLKLRSLIPLLILILSAVLTACGGSDTSIDSSSSVSTSIEVAENDSQEIDSLAPPEPQATVDILLGEWVDVDYPERYVKITKTSTGYLYEDNDGKYNATFEKGVLKLNVSVYTESENAEAYYENKLGNMVMIYKETLSKFKKK